MTKEAEVEDEAEVEVEAVGIAKNEEKIINKLKMKKEVSTTLYMVEDAIVEEAAKRIDTISIVIIMVNMIITQVNAISKKRWRRMLILKVFVCTRSLYSFGIMTGDWVFSR
jgi:hypothetical protein